MPTKLNVPDARKLGENYYEIPVSEIVVDESRNGRAYGVTAKSQRKRVAELAQRIIDNGQIQPVEAHIDENGKPVLDIGYRRWAAIKKINEDGLEFPIKVLLVKKDSEDPEKETLLRNLHENVDRENLTPIDIGKLAVRLSKDHGMTQAEIAKHFGKSEGWVSQHVSLVKNLSKEMQNAVANYYMTQEAATDLLSYKDPTERDEIFRAMMEAIEVTEEELEESNILEEEEGGEEETSESSTNGAGKKGKKGKKAIAKKTAKKVASREDVQRAAEARGSALTRNRPPKAVIEALDSISANTTLQAPARNLARALAKFCKGSSNVKSLTTAFENNCRNN